MLIIRLQRVGKKNQAAFRIVLAEKERAVKKLAVEILGHYNPRTKEFGIKDQARLEYWLGQHVQVSPTVNNLLIDKGLLKAEKVKAWKPKAKPQEETKAAAPAPSAAPQATAPEPPKETPAPETPATEPEKKEEPKSAETPAAA